MPNKKISSLTLRRKRFGYEQKQIANLLGHKTIYQICRYESGQRTPSLKDAMKLSVIFQIPICVLFESYLSKCREDLKNHLKDSGLNRQFDLENLPHAGYCSYLELMVTENINAFDADKIWHHIKTLVEERSEKILGNQP